MRAPEPEPASPTTLPALVDAYARSQPEAVALASPGRPPLSYRGLAQHVHAVVAALNSLGIGRGQRVATGLPNGPELASAVLAISAGATCVPLNPALRPAELHRYLQLTRADAVLVPAGQPSDLREAARALGLICLELRSDAQRPAGVFSIDGATAGPAAPSFAEPGDVALLMQTSGTTAESDRPRLVPLTHTNVSTSALHTRSALALTPADRCLNVMPVFLIHGIVGATFSSLSAGASIVCVDRFDPGRFLDWLAEFAPTWYTAVPTMHQALLAQLAGQTARGRSPRLRFIRSSSAPLSVDVLGALEAAFGVPVIESYGMTEAASQIASNPLPPDRRKPGSVGRPHGPQVAIRGETGALLGPNQRGEIVVRGPNVMHGYEQAADAGAEAFVDGWLRTGDEGFLDEDGYLFITGRIKELINRGGEKIVPAEVDTVLRQHPAVADAVAFAKPHPRLGEVVAAAVVLQPGASLDRKNLRAFAAERLAPAKVPHDFYVVERIPRNALGKLQRRLIARQILASAEHDAAPGATPRSNAPESEHQRIVREVWQELLGRSTLGPDDDFFVLGGDSLLGLQLLARLAARLDVELPVQTLFEAPTLAEFAARVAQAAADRQTRSDLPAPGADAGPAPLASVQQRFWYTDRLDPDGCVNNLARAFRLRGPLDVPALAAALSAVVERHPALRTTFPSSAAAGQLQQVVQPARPIDLPLGTLGDQPEASLHQLLRQEARRPFRLETEPPIRARLLRLAEQDHVLLLTVHHIATDGWSNALIDRDLSELYTVIVSGQPAALPPLATDYLAFTRRQRERLRAGAFNAELDYWRRQLAGAPALLSLPTAGRRPPTQTFRGARTTFALSADCVAQLSALARQHQATLYMALLAVFAALLQRHSGEDELVIGSPVAGRGRPGTHDVVGCFINSLALRVDLRGGPSFVELLGRVRQVVQGALAHQELPFDALVEALRPPRDARSTPLFQVMFALQNLPPGGLALPGIQATELDVDPGTARLDLIVTLQPAGSQLRGTLEYCTDLFSADRMARLVEHYQRLLRGVLDDPRAPIGQLPLLGDDEWQRLVVGQNATARPYPRERSIPELFEVQADRTPNAAAVRIAGRQLSYAELDARANQLAQLLHARAGAAGASGRVAVCLPRSVELVVAVLAILKAGMAYLPLDVAHPSERLAFMLEDAAAGVVVTDTATAAHLGPAVLGARQVVCVEADAAAIAAQSTARPDCSVAATDAAYVMYTSGSTGRPKGVVIPHRGVVRLVRGTDYLQLGPADRVAFASDFAFDASTFELWGALLNGACLVGLDKDTLLAPPTLAAALRAERITTLFVTTAVFNLCARELPDAFGSLDHLLFGGEAADPRAVAAVLASGRPPRRLLHVYGPTESTTFATWYEVREVAQDAETVPIGRPIAHTRAYVLDAQRQPTPWGTPGELYLGGDGLAIEYLNQPQLTAERFVPDPFAHEPGSRLYRTGDRVAYRSDGELVFLGRFDDQVKVRGFRVEPGEVEAVLLQHPRVRQAAVVAREDAAGTRQLVAYLVPHTDGAEAVELADLRRYLAARLPEPMRPAALVPLAALPLTPAGKLDRAALPPVDPTQAASPASFVAPRTPLEASLARTWAALLGLERVGVRDNFFELGGHSLLAARLFGQLESDYGVRLPLASLLPEPTIEHQAALLEGHGAQPAEPHSLVPLQPLGDRPPLICVHAIDGDVLRFEPLARQLGPDQPFYALRARGLDATPAEPIDDLETMAAVYVDDVLRAGLRAPFYLAGFSSGASVAYEMAQQLHRRGQAVALLALIDGRAPCRPASRLQRLRRGLEDLPADLRAYAADAFRQGDLRTFVRRKVRDLPRWLQQQAGGLPPGAEVLDAVAGLSAQHLAVAQAQFRALAHYTPQPSPIPLTLFRARVRLLLSSHDRSLNWDLLLTPATPLHRIRVGGEHADLLRPPHVQALATALRQAIDHAPTPST